MTDEKPWYAPGYRGKPTRQRKPGEATWHCELAFRGESYGWEAQIFRETDFTIGRRFILKEEAAGWGEWMKG